ncbi:MAG TPA: hypothetical protein VMU87_05000 [Stellaceae bacterium]|nr:hypothetical protein [Stellaceae bacterium]
MSAERAWRRSAKEWETGQHLRCMVRINYQTHMGTRWAVPIDEKTTRMFYFHTALRRTALGRAYEWCAYHFFHHWVMDQNFSAQDARPPSMPITTAAWRDGNEARCYDGRMKRP